jgi:hypothetical protein
MSKPRRVRDELSADFPSKPRRVRDELSADFTDRMLEVGGSSNNFERIRFYLKHDYNQELDFVGPSVAVLIEVEFGLTTGEVVALSAAELEYLLGQAHRCKGALTSEERQRVLTEVAGLRTRLANLPNPSPGEAALLKALARFPAPQADEEDPGRDYMPFRHALEEFRLTASQLSKACREQRVRCRGRRKARMVHVGDLYINYGTAKRAQE